MGSLPCRRGRRAAANLAVLMASGLVLASCGSSSPVAATQPLGSGYPNGDLSNTRSFGGPINAANVAKMEAAWSLPVTGKGDYGDYASTPIVSDGVVYSQDLGSNVQAISLQSGKVLWSHPYELPDHGPNGLVVAGGRIYGATPTSAFALDQRTGKQLWLVRLVENGQAAGIDMAPGYHDGLVYVSTVPGDEHEPETGEGVGTLWALNAVTGQKVWHFNTVPEDLWSAQHGAINSGGGAWYTPAFDGQGSMYVGIANPEPSPGIPGFPFGSSRPGPDLYTDSIVKLDAATGRLEWHFQLTPHDLYDWDLQEPPILVKIGGRQAVISAGKGGVVLALDAETGKLLWKRPVGIHNGHEHDSLYAMKGEYAKIKLPATVYPGRLGGVIAPMASNGALVFAPVVNSPQVISTSQEVQEPGPSSGEVVAIDAATGAIKWTHRFSAPAFGGVTVVNDLVLSTTVDGVLRALNAATGALVWQSQLPAESNSGVAVSGNTLLAPAGLVQESGQTAEITAFRLPAGGG